ncbi:helix-turn-helix domain-containing protein [Microbacterium bovistercoris]|uniref:Helix-turn-helix domain-containing protein n=1 Tax=Microbacterium bovistercoris TaxID=2293570 RepID=A0A371NV09_9MICO|nr:excisionase family DNA-binding protein [Microbacterium bovistercoris]REJ06306.1 helix-turn-helix domain-containing protein [Microbacterium bovistercoris]
MDDSERLEQMIRRVVREELAAASARRTNSRSLTTDELASPEYLNCHPDTVRAKARRGDIPFFKVGTEYRFDWEDVKKALTPEKVDPWINPRSRQARRPR